MGRGLGPLKRPGAQLGAAAKAPAHSSFGHDSDDDD